MADPLFLTGLCLAGILVCLMLIGPLVSRHDPHDMSFVPLSPPGADHWLGVNDGGMDIFAELVAGMGNTLGFGLFAAACGLGAGGVIGLMCAWYGGLTDRILMRVSEIIMAVPSVMILILAAAFFRPSPIILGLILAAMTWPVTAKGIRAQARVIIQSLHIQAARQMGGSAAYIIGRHLMPELYPLYLIGLSSRARMAMFMEASLSFMGLFDPGRKSLGIMIHYALKFYYLDIWWNWLMPPILCLTLMIMTVTFLAISLEKVFDPRLRQTW